MKRTLLYDKHVELGAKIVPFAGWEMPVQYSSIIEEHKNVRENVGVFDVSHMGEFFITGKDALAFLQYVVPQDVSALFDTKALYTQLTNKSGGIIDDLIIYKLSDNNYLLIVNASRIDVDYEWLKENSADFEVSLDNKSDDYSMLALQGPKASDLIEKMGIEKTEQPKSFMIKKTKILNYDVYLSRTGYTGEDGFEIIVENKDIVKFFNQVMDMGKEFSILPIGLGARDTLRLEAAMPLYGNDLNEDTTPIEAGLKWSVPVDKKEDYNGKDMIIGQATGKIPLKKKLIGFEMLDRAIPRHEYEVYYENEKIGIVTSGGPSPSTGKNIGLAHLIVKENSIFLNKTIGINIEIMVRNKLYKAQIVKRPFIQKKNSIK